MQAYFVFTMIYAKTELKKKRSEWFLREQRDTKNI